MSTASKSTKRVHKPGLQPKSKSKFAFAPPSHVRVALRLPREDYESIVHEAHVQGELRQARVSLNRLITEFCLAGLAKMNERPDQDTSGSEPVFQVKL